MATYDITALSTALEFDTTNSRSKYAVAIPGTNRFIMGWAISTTVFYVQCFSVDQSTGAVTAIGSPVDIEPGTSGGTGDLLWLVLIDSSNACVFWEGPGFDGFAQLISIDGSGNCSLNGSSLEYDTAQGVGGDAVLIDSTHIFNIWQSSASDGVAAVLSVNTGTGTISVVGTPFKFAEDFWRGELISLPGTNKLLAVYNQAGSANVLYRVLEYNASTYAVTAAGAEGTIVSVNTVNGGLSLTFIEDLGSTMRAGLVADSSSAVTTTLYTLSINTSTWVVSSIDSLQLSTATALTSTGLAMVNNVTFLVFYAPATNNGAIETVSYDPSTGGVGSVLDSLTFESTEYEHGCRNVIDLGNGRYAWAWQGINDDGFTQAFQVEIGPANVKTIDGHGKSSIGDIDGLVMANIKSLNGVT